MHWQSFATITLGGPLLPDYCHSSFPLALVTTTNLFPISSNLLFLNISYKWNHKIQGAYKKLLEMQMMKIIRHGFQFFGSKTNLHFNSIFRSSLIHPLHLTSFIECNGFEFMTQSVSVVFSFYCWIVFYYMDTAHFHVHLPVWWTFLLFPMAGMVMNNASMRNHVQVSMWAHTQE